MPKIGNLVHETSTTTGTGNFTLTNANGKQSFNGEFGNGSTTNVFFYFISNRDVASEREWGTGHMSASSTLVRDTVLGGSNGTSAVNFSAGTKDVTNDTPAASRREVLTANRTYYVRTDGSDSNDGLANTSGGAFLTKQKAIDVVAGLDISIYNVTIQVGNGTYTGNVSVSAPWVGSGTVTLLGDASTPSNVVMSGSGVKISVSPSGRLSISGLDISTSGDSCLYASGQSRITISGACRFGTVGTRHMWAEAGAKINITADYTIYGGGVYHYFIITTGQIACIGRTVTSSGTPAFSGSFVLADRIGLIEAHASTYSGAATGKRYQADSNAVIFTNGGGASYFPGNSAGSTSTGGQYI